MPAILRLALTDGFEHRVASLCRPVFDTLYQDRPYTTTPFRWSYMYTCHNQRVLKFITFREGIETQSSGCCFWKEGGEPRYPILVHCYKTTGAKPVDEIQVELLPKLLQVTHIGVIGPVASWQRSKTVNPRTCHSLLQISPSDGPCFNHQFVHWQRRRAFQSLATSQPPPHR